MTRRTGIALTVVGTVLALSALLVALYGFGGRGLVRVGVITHAAVTEPALTGFKAGMAARGWHEDRDILFVFPGISADAEALHATARTLVDDGVAMILALSTPATQAAQRAARGTGIPIVFAPASDPVGAGLVASLGHPGGNTTGVAFGLQEARRLEWLKRLKPDLDTVFVPYNPTDRSATTAIAKLQASAAKLSVRLLLRAVTDADDLHSALREIPPTTDAIFVPPDALIASNMPELVAAARRRRILLTVPHRDGVRQGATFSYGFDLFQLGQQAARLADMILAGAKPADIPVETAEFRLSINLAAAQAIGLTIPDGVLRQADLVSMGGP